MLSSAAGRTATRESHLGRAPSPRPVREGATRGDRPTIFVSLMGRRPIGQS